MPSNTCGAKTKRGDPCRRRVREGAVRCRTHGGATSQAKHAAERRRVEARARRKLAGRDVEPVEDPVRELLVVVGEARALKDVLADQWEAQRSNAAVDAYGRALDRISRLLVDVNRLGLEERLVRIEELKVRNVAVAVRGVLQDAGLHADDPDVRKSLRHHLLAVEAGRAPASDRPMPTGTRTHDGIPRVTDALRREWLGEGDDPAAVLVSVAEVIDVVGKALRR